MTIQIATLCDSASDYSGKLCILGAFDNLCSREFPVTHPACALVVRTVAGLGAEFFPDLI